MTLKEAQAIAKANRFTIRHNHWDREYRVNLIGGTEETAYYTNDRDDAVETGKLMVAMKLVNEMRTAVDVTVKAFESADDSHNVTAMIVERERLAAMCGPIAQATPIESHYHHPAEALYREVSQALWDMDILIRSDRTRTEVR